LLRELIEDACDLVVSALANCVRDHLGLRAAGRASASSVGSDGGAVAATEREA
jgi:hypothetical protein